VDSRAGLDGCGKSRPHQDSIPEPSVYRMCSDSNETVRRDVTRVIGDMVIVN
jgi:hypothetical protein